MGEWQCKFLLAIYISFDIILTTIQPLFKMKDIAFLGTSLDDIKAFPDDIRQDVGYQLHLVQSGEMPTDFKYMKSIGVGVIEIRQKDENGIYRTIYTAKFADCVYVLHAFVKKTQKTSKADIEIAKSRLKSLIQELNND